jgi:hypothetical protein
MTPNTGVFLVYPEGTVTTKYAQTIRHRATTSPLRSHIQEKNQYSDSTMEKINWLAHGKAMKAMIKRRTHLTKLVHECLPTLERQNKFDSGNRKCPGCLVHPENRDHILRCQVESRSQWRSKFTQTLVEFHDKVDTYPLIWQALNESIQSWMNATDDVEYCVNATIYQNNVRLAIRQQNEMGWRQVINGRFSIEWSRIQDDYYARSRTQKQNNDRRSGHRWQIKLIHLIWTEWDKLWKIRNEELHGRDSATRAATERREITNALRTVYDQYEPRVQELLTEEEHQHLSKPHWLTKNWLTVNAPIFRESARRAKAKAILGVGSIRLYFPPAW